MVHWGHGRTYRLASWLRTLDGGGEQFLWVKYRKRPIFHTLNAKIGLCSALIAREIAKFAMSSVAVENQSSALTSAFNRPATKKKFLSRVAMLLSFCAPMLVAGCGYISMAARRQYLLELSKLRPAQSITREVEYNKCHTIYGRIKSIGTIRNNLAVCAISYRYGKQDIVAATFACGKGYYALLLPSGQYQLVAFADVNKDSAFSASECAGFYHEKPFVEIRQSSPAVVGGFDMYVSDTRVFTLDQPISLSLPESYSCHSSSYYPPGAIRSLEDPLFSEQVARKGRFSVAEFLNEANGYFYAVSERNLRKTPILFIHGYGGTPRDFAYFIAHLDTARYDPWFFYYPGAQSISKTADIMYEIFFSNNIIELDGRRMIIIAHSMGGLVARQALNRYSANHRNHSPIDFFSLCTPYGGVAYAAAGAQQAPTPVPSWKDIGQNSPFIQALPKRALAGSIRFRLFFGYRDESIVRFFHNSDGVIQLKSQLHSPVQQQAAVVRGFDETHTSILSSSAAVNAIYNALDSTH